MEHIQGGIACGSQINAVSQAMALADDAVVILVFRHHKNGSHGLLRVTKVF
jgi:hypothetical protein